MFKEEPFHSPPETTPLSQLNPSSLGMSLTPPPVRSPSLSFTFSRFRPYLLLVHPQVSRVTSLTLNRIGVRVLNLT